MPARPDVVVVGGAVLDAKLHLVGAAVLGTSNPGAAVSGVGGVGRNVAENLARLGTSVSLVAAVGEDPAGDAVLAHCRGAGVGCEHVVRSPHPTGTYTAVLDGAGDLVLAVADMRATDELFVADLGAVPTLLAGARLLVLDCNLDVDVIRWLLAVAARADVPAVLEPVSVAKAMQAAPALDGTVPLHTVTPNVEELGALVGGAVQDTVDAVVGAAAVLHARGVERVWVRRGANGSVLSVDGEPGRAVLVAAPRVEVADVTGAGDAMTAGYVHALLRGGDVVQAARYGQVLAALTCASSDTVRPDLTAALVAAHLTPTEPRAEDLPR